MIEKVNDAFIRINKGVFPQKILSYLDPKDMELIEMYGSLLFSLGVSHSAEVFITKSKDIQVKKGIDRCLKQS